MPVLGSVRCASDSQACVQGINSLYKQETLVLAGSSARGEGTCLHVSQDRKLQLTGTQNINDQELVIVMCVALHDLSLWLL